MRSLSIALLLTLLLSSSALAGEIHLSVAASMTDAVKELSATYQKKTADVVLLANFASSGALAKQIAQGAPADIFISANPKWMTYLVDEKRIPTETVRTFAYNSLVFVGAKGLPVVSMQDLVHLKRIAIGSPQSVPAGQYAEQAFKAAGLYDALKDKLVMAQDVRQALVYAERGEAEGAFVYKTDALLAKEAVILFEVPQALYTEVAYPIGLTAEGADNKDAKAFYDFLKTDAAGQILKKFGFVVR